MRLINIICLENPNICLICWDTTFSVLRYLLHGCLGKNKVRLILESLILEHVSPSLPEGLTNNHEALLKLCAARAGGSRCVAAYCSAETI